MHSCFRPGPYLESKQKEKETKKNYFWPGAISITEQQYDKTKKKEMIRVHSKDLDQVGHLASLNVTVIFFTIGLWVQATP